jgi:CRP/FNR family transcriptional regulator
LDERPFEELSKMARVRRYKRGDILFYEGEEPTALTVLTKGSLKLYKTSDQHKEVVMHRFRPVSMVAEVALLHGIPYPASAVFEEAGEVISIDYQAFESVFLSDPKLSRMLILSLSNKIRVLESMIERNLVMSAEERVLNFIASTPERFMTMRRYEIANELNMTPETFSRMIKRLLEKGRIVKEGDTYALLS